MNPETTLMFAEAAEAGAVVARQRAANADRLAALVDRLRDAPPRAAITCARGSSDHAATFAKYLIETRLGLLDLLCRALGQLGLWRRARLADVLCHRHLAIGQEP